MNPLNLDGTAPLGPLPPTAWTRFLSRHERALDVVVGTVALVVCVPAALIGLAWMRVRRH